MITYIDLLTKDSEGVLRYSQRQPATKPAPALLVSDAVFDDLDGDFEVIDGYSYLSYYQVVASPDTPYAPKPPPPVDLMALKIAHVSNCGAQIREFVELHISLDEREQYNAILQRIVDMRSKSQSVDEGVEGSVRALLVWCEDAMIHFEDIKNAILVAADQEAVGNIYPDFVSLMASRPSKESPGHLLKVLRGLV